MMEYYILVRTDHGTDGLPGAYVLSSKKFSTYAAAASYVASVSVSRDPLVVMVCKPALDVQDVRTAAGEVFTGAESRMLARAILRRFGYDLSVAAAAWRRLMATNVTDEAFRRLCHGDDTP